VDDPVAENHLSRRVLIVEGAAAASALISDALTEAGFETRIATTGPAAVAQLENWRPDLAVVGDNLPDTVGAAVAGLFRPRFDTPFVLVSASTDESIAAQAAGLGAAAYVVEPFDARSLVSLVRSLLARADAERRLRDDVERLATERARSGVDAERRLLAAELHDGVGQELAGAVMLAHAIARRWARDRVVKAAEVEQLRQTLADASEQCRTLSHEKFHGIVPGSGLGRALRRLATAETALGAVHCSYSGPSVMPTTITTAMSHHLLRVAQEAVRNAAMHSGGSRIVVSLRLRSDQVELSIRDDGRGIEPAPGGATSGIGLQTMHLRAKTLGGAVLVRKIPTGGSEVVVTIPLAAGNEAARD